jgi:hypothetical protein
MCGGGVGQAALFIPHCQLQSGAEMLHFLFRVVTDDGDRVPRLTKETTFQLSYFRNSRLDRWTSRIFITLAI